MPLKDILRIAAGFIFLGLGAVGVVLPLLPTTPFVLVSAACFATVPELQAKVMCIPFFNAHIRNYQHGSGLSKKHVIVSLSTLWITLILTIIFTHLLWLRILLTIIGTVVTIHIIKFSKPRNITNGS